jgi:hypothetical protein
VRAQRAFKLLDCAATDKAVHLYRDCLVPLIRVIRFIGLSLHDVRRFRKTNKFIDTDRCVDRSTLSYIINNLLNKTANHNVL